MNFQAANLTSLSDLDFDTLHYFKGCAYASFDMITLTNHRQLENVVIEKQKGKGSGKKRLRFQKERTKSRKRVRWSEVRKRCTAFFNLKKSQSFSAFYTISFPKGLSDENARKCLNNWLTRLRSFRPNMPYLWVAERQRNGTLHFHLLTNVYMPVKVINGFMATALNGVRNVQPSVFTNWIKGKYNGVDVRHIRNSKNLKGYLAKYITKADQKIDGSPWHCSRLFSNLSTTITVHSVDAYNFIQALSRSADFQIQNIRVFSTEFATTLILPNQIPKRWISPILQFNENLSRTLDPCAK